MAKIIKVDAGEVTIVQNDGSIISVMDYTLDFTPHANEEVEVYQKDDEWIIVKASPKVVHSGKKPVNKIAYGLLGILLGGLGVHKFYAGKIGLGIVYILFSWTGIPSIIGLIEGIIGLTKEEEEPGMILV